MRVVVAGFGTRGDVQPMLALALVLRARGHEVKVCAPPDFTAWVQELGLPFGAVGESMQSIVERAADRHGNVGLRAAAREMPRQATEQFAQLAPHVAGIDVLVAASLSSAGPSLAEKHGFRYRYVVFSPSLVPSAAHPAPFVVSQTLPGWLNRASWWMTHRVHQSFFRSGINAERAKLGLPPVGSVFDHLAWHDTIIASEPSIAGLPPETPAGVVQTGAWFMPEHEELPADLSAFLEAGPPPVYIGFGSMPDSDPVQTSRRVLEAVQQAGVRALLSRGWAGLGKVDLPPTVRVIGPTAHGKLFPRVAAVVHHGGAGTTANAARSSVPQIIVPHLLDQYFWCYRVWRLGLSPPPIRKGRLRADALAAAIRTCVEEGTLRERARTFAAGMTRDGLDRAVALIEGRG